MCFIDHYHLNPMSGHGLFGRLFQFRLIVGLRRFAAQGRRFTGSALP
jgi:hypothetical protein